MGLDYSLRHSFLHHLVHIHVFLRGGNMNEIPPITDEQWARVEIKCCTHCPCRKEHEAEEMESHPFPVGLALIVCFLFFIYMMALTYLFNYR